MSVTLALLFDEDTEAKFARLCEKEGHDVERVVDISELCRGAKDTEIRRYANSTDRIVVTHDDDYVSGTRADDDRTFLRTEPSAVGVRTLSHSLCRL
jgi:predicted nuclease of predicted toxin-antitoxin system